METYIILGNFTQQGAEALNDSPQRIEAAREATEAAGGKFLGWYLTMGQYDFVVIVEGTDAKTAAALLLATGMQGNFRTETLQAFTEDEFKGILNGLP